MHDPTRKEGGAVNSDDLVKEGRPTNPRIVLNALRNQWMDGKFMLVKHDDRGDVNLKLCRTGCRVGRTGIG